MRRSYKYILIFIFIFIFTLLLLFMLGSNKELTFEKERKKFDRITIGIIKDSVLMILGKPDQITYSIDPKVHYYYYFTKNKIGWSTMPYVEFDSTQRVVKKFYGSGD